MKAEELVVGGRYNWIGQPERLVYMGSKVYPCRRRWYQFALVSKPHVCWSEVLESDLSSFEETVQHVLDIEQPPLKLSAMFTQVEWKAAKRLHYAFTSPRRKGENRAQHRKRVGITKE